MPSLDRWRTVRSALSFGLCFGVVTAVAGVPYGVFAAIGCYVDAYGTRDPYPRRGPVLALLCAGFVLAFTAGSLAAGDVWAMTAVLTVVSVAATLVVRTLRLSGPGSYFVILVTALAAFLPPVGPAETAARAGCVAIGVTVSWLSAMSGRLVRPYEPEERTVSAAFRSVGAFADATRRAAEAHPSKDLTAVRRSAYTAVHGAWTALDDTRRRRAAPAPRRLALHALMVRLDVMLDAVQSAAERRGEQVPASWGSWLRDAAAAVGTGRTPGSWPVAVGARPAVPPLVAGDRAPASPASPASPEGARVLWPVPLPPRKSLGAELRLSLSSASPAPTIALRVGLSVAVGTVLGWALPLLHPAWVAVGAAAALQGGPGQQPSQRVGSRFAGTVAGVAITVLVAQVYRPGVWATVVLATVVHAVSRALPPTSLLARTLLNTPVALLLVNAAFVGGPGLEPLAAYRLLDLTLGLCLGVCAALLVRGVPVRRVCAAVSGAVAATGPAVAERLRTGSAGAGSEGAAWQRAADLWTMHASVPVEEIRSTGTADRLWPAVLAVRRLLTWNVLGGPTTPAPDDAARAEAFLHVLADAARAGLPGSPGLRSALPHPLRTPEPAHEPEVRRRLAALRAALERPVPPSPGTAAPDGAD
ncbi:FUSC family protein [Streptomyces prasinopilosus]|uniref:FUSC family protein n=1 Tax=Streptomyces prasinopilosus TaxID=67344 RepID=UPI000AC9D163|nr:FUSC family protein [Streptomyces prasinopilosus]